ncbi:MAG: spore protease YyaC [Clostridia bacterium]|nr:spore protease YyaC [Clostridia bacterium]
MHFGPLVGTRLTNLLRNARRLNVIGTLSDNISLCNIKEVIDNINNTYTNPFIVAIDAALSTSDRVGQILVTDGPLQLGSSLNRTGVQIGDMAIRGVVGRNTGNINQNLNILRNVPLARVVNLSDIVSSGIYNCINYECNE